MREFPPCHHKTHQAGCFACDKWANDPSYRARWNREPSNKVRRLPMPTEGPGTELEKLLHEMGFQKGPSCGCQYFKAWMNRLGVEGCRRERETIIAQLREQSARSGASFGKKLLAAFRTGIWSVPGLVDEAIRRSRLD